jgi:hypothetical protein
VDRFAWLGAADLMLFLRTVKQRLRRTLPTGAASPADLGARWFRRDNANPSVQLPNLDRVLASQSLSMEQSIVIVSTGNDGWWLEGFAVLI